MRARSSILRSLGALAALSWIVAAACVPVENAPPGGGEIVHETFRLGPFNLAPQGQWGEDDEGFAFDVPRPSGSFGIKTVNFDIVDAQGDPVPRHDAHLHHIVMLTSAANDTYCPGGERFAGAGAERNPIELADPYAYLVGANDQWSATWHVMNTSDQRLDEVYIEYEIGYQPDANAENSRGVTAFFLDVTGCITQYDVPGDGGPGSVHTKTNTWTAPWDGYIVYAVGHLHGGGIDITIRDPERDFECTMTAEYGDSHGEHDEHDDHSDPGSGDGHGHGMPPDEITRCPLHYPVKAGQEFQVISRYDNSQPYDGAMGIVRAYAWEGSQ